MLKDGNGLPKGGLYLSATISYVYHLGWLSHCFSEDCWRYFFPFLSLLISEIIGLETPGVFWMGL